MTEETGPGVRPAVERRQVSSEEFDRAYYGVPGDEASLKAAADNRSVIKGVLRKFAGQIDKDDLHACGLNALWRCLQYHREGFNQKFTTSLHKFTDWECKRELRRAGGGRRKDRVQTIAVGNIEAVIDARVKRDVRDFDPRDDDREYAREVVGLLDDAEQRRVVRQYFFDGLTMEEVGRANGYSKESARQKINGAVAALRGVCEADLGGPDGVVDG